LNYGGKHKKRWKLGQSNQQQKMGQSNQQQKSSPDEIALLILGWTIIISGYIDCPNSLVVSITVTCYLWAPSSGDHLLTYGAISRQRCTGSGLDSGRIQHILNKPDRIRTAVLLKFQDQEFISNFFGIWRQHNHKNKFFKDLKAVMQFASTPNVWKRRCYTGHVVHCRAPVHHHSIPSVH